MRAIGWYVGDILEEELTDKKFWVDFGLQNKKTDHVRINMAGITSENYGKQIWFFRPELLS